MATKNADSRCSLTSIKWGFSPGACVLDITVKADVWTIDLTAAAHIHGKPKNPHRTLMMQIITMSRCKPLPFFSLRSALPIINLEQIKDSYNYEIKKIKISCYRKNTL